MTDLVIRLAMLSDLQSVAAIYREAVLAGTATFEIDPPDDAEMTRRYESLRAGGFPYLVALRDDAVLGYAYAGPYRARIAYRFTVEDSVYLDTHARGQGVGTALLNALVAESAAAGFKQMIAVIGDSANAASIAVHRRCGFTDAGTLRDVGFKFERWIDTVLMQRAL